MKRTTKYTHITARTTLFMKDISIATCKEECNNSLSWAWRRLSEGKGLLNCYDQESFEIWTQVINNVRQMCSPVLLPARMFAEMNRIREEKLTAMEEYRAWLERGSNPVYVDTLFTEEQLFILLYETPEVLVGPDCRKYLQNNYEDIIQFLQKRISELPEIPRNVDFSTTYQIRVDYDHKVSVSKVIRSLLDGIYNVPSITNEAHRDIYQYDLEQIKKFQKWYQSHKPKDEKAVEFSPISDLIFDHISDFIKSIRIPSK